MSDLNFSPPVPEPDPDPCPEIEPGPGRSSIHEETPQQIVQPGYAQHELFASWSQPEIVPPTRIPHLGHLALFGAFLLVAFATMTVLMLVAVHFHVDGVSNLENIKTNVRYILGSEAILYVITLALSFIAFPMFWNKSFLDGIQWRAATALRLYQRLIGIALGCIILAFIDDRWLPGPANAPIDDMFRSPGAAWLMFAFGVTFAPFFEEIAFRGFMLPSLATAWDWAIEISTGRAARPIDEYGHPRWSLPAMVAASLVTSVPFALLHADQTGWSTGPFVLLLVVSLILCAVRLSTRSLASSTLVHASYNFILFSTALVSSGGFRHFDKF